LNDLPSVEYQNVAESTAGVESEITRSQIVLPVTAALAAVAPVFVVTQEKFIVMLFTMFTVNVLPVRQTPMYALTSRKRPSPARSPAFMALKFILIVAVEMGPSWRRVRVLRAAYQSFVSCRC
jgi:phosphatidylserine synthase